VRRQISIAAPNKKPPRGELLIWGDVVEEVRTVFEKLDDVNIYIPEFQIELV
jgi:hypothetical protein